MNKTLLLLALLSAPAMADNVSISHPGTVDIYKGNIQGMFIDSHGGGIYLTVDRKTTLPQGPVPPDDFSGYSVWNIGLIYPGPTAFYSTEYCSFLYSATSSDITVHLNCLLTIRTAKQVK